jgi:hypothetical protein
MMRLSKVLNIGGRKITVREFDADTVYALLDWMEQPGNDGLKAHELLARKNELLTLIRDCVVPADGGPIDFNEIGFEAFMQIVDGLQAVNQAFLILLIRTGKMPMDGALSASPSS